MQNTPIRRTKLSVLVVVFLGMVWFAAAGAGCTWIEKEAELPTLIPEGELPTIIAETAQALIPPTETMADVAASPTPDQTAVPEESPTEPPVFQTPVPQETQPVSNPPEASQPSPDEIPFAAIRIIRPGPLSRIVSPIDLHVFLSPGEGRRVQVELHGEDGRLMYRKVFRYNTAPSAQVKIYEKIKFEVSGVAETVRLTITTFDSHGRVQALAAEDLILMASGDSDINPPGDLLSNLVIRQPEPRQLIQGGKVIVSGLVRTTSDQPLSIELITEEGKVAGTRLAAVSSNEKGSEKGGHRLFAAEVPYHVQSPTWVRVTVIERGIRRPGAVYITTTDVLLSP